MSERIVFLFGKTGNGKSSTGNSILGNRAFEHKKSLSSVTKECEMSTAINPINKRTYSVCDTPGVLDTDVSFLERLKCLIKAVEICKGPHAFLLVFDSSSRFSEDEQHTVTILQILFGATVFDRCIIVFTRGDIFETDTDFESFVKSSTCFVNLLEKCGKRVVRIENSKSNGGQNLQCLLEMIEKVSDGGRLFYQYPFLDTHIKVLNDYSEKHMNTNTEITKHLANISKNLDEQLMTDHKRLNADNEKLKKENKTIEDLKAENKKLKKDYKTMEDGQSKAVLAGAATGAIGSLYVIKKISSQLFKAGANAVTRSKDEISEPISLKPAFMCIPQPVVPDPVFGGRGPKVYTSKPTYFKLN